MLIGRNIATLRRKQRMRQKELARVVGVSEDYISRIERGRIPAKKLTVQIANALGVSFDKLLGEGE